MSNYSSGQWQLGSRSKDNTGLPFALVICGFAIRCFDYSRTQKQNKAPNNEEKLIFLA
jgi:hypothetical protein